MSGASDIAVEPLLSRVRHWTAPLHGPLLVGVVYYLGAQAAFYIGTLSDQIFALFWPPNVVLFCALLIVPPRQWWLYIAAAFPAHTIAELGVGMPVPQLLVAFATNCMVALLNAYGVRRFVGEPPWFGTLAKASIYILVTVCISPAISAFGGAWVPILGGGSISEYWIFWLHWYLANTLPNLTLGPVFLIWFSAHARWSRWRMSRRQVEPVVLAAALVLVCLVVAEFGARIVTSSFVPALLLSPLPLVLWAAVRYGEKGASGAILILAVVLTWGLLHGPGLFPGDGPERNVLALQLFLTGLAIPVLLLGALIDELRHAERTTRELAASMLRAQDEERRRIARDLHDSTGQNLIAATLIAGSIEDKVPAAAAPAFRQLEQMLQQSIGEVRTVSYLLHPPLLDEAGLELALRYFLQGYTERSGVAASLEISPKLDRLAPDSELVLFRIVQEALTNIARHSGSTTARIRLVRRNATMGQNIVLTIEDEGRGLPGAGAPHSSNGSESLVAPGVGLASMRERLHQLGGRLEIDSAVGHTRLTAVIPIHDRGRD
jgi:signal transduction histidine kinase